VIAYAELFLMAADWDDGAIITQDHLGAVRATGRRWNLLLNLGRLATASFAPASTSKNLYYASGLWL
jgi:hypothetical protein